MLFRTRLLPRTRRLAFVLGVLMLSVLPAAAQQDSPTAELRSVLRAFYFNLSHHDWEAIAADVLSAKVLASRAFPLSLRASTSRQPVTCSPVTSPAAHALIQTEGDWAAVSVPRCPGADEFRLVRFGHRWRFIYIALFQGPTEVSLTNFEGGLFPRRCRAGPPANSRGAARLARGSA